MKVPPLLLGASFVFWGWQTGYWAMAAGMAILYEGHYLIPARWHFSTADIRRISDFCTILFAGMVVYLLFSEQNVYFVLILIQLIPIALFPLILVQAYSQEGKIDIRALFVIMRKRVQDEDPAQEYRMNLTYPYLILVVMAASAANQRTGGFYVGLVVLTVLGLWRFRSRRYPVVWWMMLIIIAAAGGYAGHNGLHRFQLYLEAKGMQWYRDFGGDDGDPFQTRTAIGDIGALKPSSRILFRVAGDHRHLFPLKLQQAVYSSYGLSRWSASRSGFAAVPPGTEPGAWPFQTTTAGTVSIRVLKRYSRDAGLLLLPKGAAVVADLKAETVEMNRLGTVKIEARPGLLHYTVGYNPGTILGGAPDSIDLAVSPREKDVLQSLVTELDLTGISPPKRLERIGAFFRNRFTYSLRLEKGSGSGTPLNRFLTETRSGHCEYFATATVLLLRAAGIPARYVRGYSVHEYSELEKRYIVRDRHAHAWVLAFVNGSWQDVDTTPAVWADMEAESASPLAWVGDLWSWFWFGLSQWWQSIREEGAFWKLWWMLIPLVLILVRRLKGLRPVKRSTSQTEGEYPKSDPPAGLDSAFYRIVKELQPGEWHREPWESLVEWFERVSGNPSAPENLHDIEALLTLHCRYRFDPLGITALEKADLARDVDSWMKSYRRRREK